MLNLEIVSEVIDKVLWESVKEEIKKRQQEMLFKKIEEINSKEVFDKIFLELVEEGTQEIINSITHEQTKEVESVVLEKGSWQLSKKIITKQYQEQVDTENANRELLNKIVLNFVKEIASEQIKITFNEQINKTISEVINNVPLELEKRINLERIQQFLFQDTEMIPKNSISDSNMQYLNTSQEFISKYIYEQIESSYTEMINKLSLQFVENITLEYHQNYWEESNKIMSIIEDQILPNINKQFIQELYNEVILNQAFNDVRTVFVEEVWSNIIKNIVSKNILELEPKCQYTINCDEIIFQILASTSPISVSKAIAYILSEIPSYIKYINISFVESLNIFDKIEIRSKDCLSSVCIKEITFKNETNTETKELIKEFVQIIKELKVTEVIFNNFKKSDFEQIFHINNENIENLRMIRIENSEDLDLETFDNLYCGSLVSSFY